MRKRSEAIEKARRTLEIDTLDSVIRAAVKHAWQATAHDASLTAQCLGLSRSTLYRYLKKYGFDQWT